MEHLNSVVVSTRIRLARNLDGFPFPNRLKDKKTAREIAERLSIPLGRIDNFRMYYVDEMSERDKKLFQENYLISRKLIDNEGISALFLNPDDTVSVMVNEEDHLREQYWSPGFCLSKAYQYLSGIDGMIGECLPFAYDREWGYLTACPSNLGTGMRASVMLFLPAIAKRHQTESLFSRVRSMGMTVRGVYGEGSASEGFMYQISNEVTLGVDENTILNEVRTQTLKLAETELRARAEDFERDPIGARDGCGRAYGILTHCERLSYPEFLRLLSDLKVGACLGLFDETGIDGLDEMVISMRDSNINRYFEEPLDEGELLYRRAKMAGLKIRELIGKDMD